MKTYKGLITSLLENQVFVFGSNPEGIHGAGAAKVAVTKYYAIMGTGRGIMGQSYGLVTKNLTPNYYEVVSGTRYPIAGVRSVSKLQIKLNILELYSYALKHKEMDFLIAYTLAPNLNGYSSEEMAEMFSFAPIPDNIIFNDEFSKLLKKNTD
jgi:hypothetical protein